MIVIQVDTKGVDEIIDRLNNLPEILEAMMEDVAQLVKEQTERRISSEKTDPDGAAWEPWSRSYAMSGRGNDLLVQSGALLGSITAEANGLEAIISSGDFKAGFHQHGTSKMPARTFLGVSAENDAEIAERCNQFLEQALGDL